MTSRELFGRPLISRRFVGAWLVLVATIPLALRSYFIRDRLSLFAWKPGEMMGINYRVYHHAAELALDGEPFYNAPPTQAFDWAVYLYPPGTLPLYYPFTFVKWTTGYTILTGLSILAAVAGTFLLVDYVESVGPRLGWVDAGIIFLAFLLSTHSFGTVYFGNINLMLALGIVFGFWALHRNREIASGVAFGIVALFKLFPALIGLWLLRTRRFRAVGAALATGIGGLLAGIALFGLDTTVFYFTEVVANRTDSSLFVGGYPVEGTYYVTVQQPVSWAVAAVWPTAPYSVIVLVSVLVVVPTVAFLYRNVETTMDRQMAIFATLAAMVTLLPSFRWYLVFLYVPMVTLLYLWRPSRSRQLFVAGGVLLSVTFSSGSVVDALSVLPAPLYSVAYAVGGAGVLPLYGILLMVLACLWEKRCSSTKQAQSPA
ncbi:glycosyltransferase family 87 protein [Halovenus rubra]|uniref:Glycosyltransferase family 87 protein n=2 Tax=Halovenus rubra TaxID=869890 RepID=A0ABD5XBV2_9EURY|nr:glycosyltransferase family 87 protein [Halovenus rubra]